MQMGRKSCCDPLGLLQSLQIDTGVQQDAQEFGHLFTSLLEATFARQADPALRNLIVDEVKHVLYLLHVNV
jgi:hypothetical protein